MEIPGIAGLYCHSDDIRSGFTSITTPMVAIGIISDTFAIAGAIFIITTYFLFKDLKTRARQFLVLIAVADLFNAIFYLTAQTYFLFTSNYTRCYVNKSTAETAVCVGQAAATNLFSLLSFSFTIILAFHVLFLFIGNNILAKKRNFYISLALGVCVPFVITSLAFWFGWFGPGETVTVGWCFIKDFAHNDTSTNISGSAVYEFLAGKLWDLITIVVISFVYFLILFRCLWKRQENANWRDFNEQNFKIVLIPAIFIFLRIWGEIHLAWTLFVPKGDIPPPLLYLQAIFEPSQGWANAIVYILWTKNVRKRILKCVPRKRKNYLAINSGDD